MHLMDKSRIPGNISNGRNPLNQHNQKPSLPTFQKSSYACYSCGSTMSILEPSVDFEMLFAVDVNALAILFVFAKKGNTQNIRVKQKLDSDEVFLEKKLFTVFDVNSFFTTEISVPLQIENGECCMQLDTGCALSLAPKAFMRNSVLILP